MYYKGKGTDVNKTEAAKWYKLAADNGNSHAMYKYAVMSELGEGIEANQILAQEYYKKALMIFETEYEVTQSPQLAYKIAILYEFGKGTEQNIEKLLIFIQKQLRMAWIMHKNALMQYKITNNKPQLMLHMIYSGCLQQLYTTIQDKVFII